MLDWQHYFDRSIFPQNTLPLDTIKVIFLKLDKQTEMYHCYLLQLSAYQICDILGVSFQSSIQSFSCMTLRNINRS